MTDKMTNGLTEAGDRARVARAILAAVKGGEA